MISTHPFTRSLLVAISLLFAAAPVSDLSAQAQAPANRAARAVQAANAQAPKAPGSGRLFELRTYTLNPGRRDAFHQQFREDIARLLVKHGISLLGVWMPDGTDNVMTVLLAFPGKPARDAAWKAVMNDPEWKSSFEKFDQEGKIVSGVTSILLDPAEYSPLQ